MEIRLLWEIFKDRYKILLLCITLFFVVAVALLKILPTVYEGCASIQVKKASESAYFIKSLPRETSALIYISADYMLGSLEFFMKNETLVNGVIEKCGLQEVVKFAPKKFSDPGLISIFFRKRGVEIEAEKDTEVFIIKGLSVNLNEAQKIANTFLEEFFAYNSSQRMKSLQNAKISYIKKAQEFKELLSALEMEELEYKKENSLCDIDLQRTNLISQLKKISDEEYQLKADFEALIDQYREIINAISKNPEYVKASESISTNEMINYYKKEIASSEAMLAEKRAELTKDHPDILRAQKRIGELKNLIKEEKEKIFSSSVSARNPYYDSLIEKKENNSIEIATLKSRLISNAKRTDELKAQLRDFLDIEKGLKDLIREKAHIEATYNNIDEGLKLLKAAEALDMNNFLVINRASVAANPKDYIYMPKTALMLVFFMISGLVSGLFLVFLLEYADETPRLFESFQSLLPESRSIFIGENKGWALLMARISKKGQIPAIAVWERMQKRKKRGYFSLHLAKTARDGNGSPFTIFVMDGGKHNHREKNSISIPIQEFIRKKDKLLAEIERRGYSPVLIDFPHLYLTSSSYLLLGDFDVLLYIIHKGKISVRDIQADINFFYDQGWQDKLIGVFYGK